MKLWKNLNSLKHKRHQQNHNGSTLLMLIICIAFLGILGTLMLSVSMINLQMKRVESKSKDNFYYCETALEEIRLGLQETAVEAIKDVYEEVLNKYIIYEAMDENVRSKTLQEMVLNNMLTELVGHTDSIIDTDRDHIADKLEHYLSLYKKDTSLTRDNFIVTLEDCVKQDLTTAYSLYIKDVKVIFKQGDYSTAITSDLRVTLPTFTFKPATETVTYGMNQPFYGYALVADGEIISDNNSGENKITGNIYSGKGITVKDSYLGLTDAHKLILNGNCIATREDIKVKDAAELSIGNLIRPFVWADNLKTETTADYRLGNSSSTKLTMNAISLLKDDLSIDGRNSEVKLSGAYVGYTGGFRVESSAMMINGSGSGLDLTGLSSLVLAGRAHISVEDSKSKSLDENNATYRIITGESLAFKSNQRAYLVPGEFIKLANGSPSPPAAMHNPILDRDCALGDPIVEITNNTEDPDKLNFYSYLNPVEPYELINRLTVTGGTNWLRYYYLKFMNGMLADKFLVDYMDKYSEALQVLGNFTLKEVKLPKKMDGSEDLASIVSVGNIMKYAPDPVKPERMTVQYIKGLSSSYGSDEELNQKLSEKKFSSLNHNGIYQNTILYNPEADKTIGDLQNMYFNITHYLDYVAPDEDSKKLAPKDQVVASKLLPSGIDMITSGYVPKSSGFTFYDSLINNRWENTDPNTKSIVVVNGDVMLAPDSYFNGVLMASGKITIGERAKMNGIIIAAGAGSPSGDVIVSNGARVYGRLIAGGNIILKEGCSVDCTGETSFDLSLSVDDFLKDIFDQDGQQLWKLFELPEVYVNSTSESATADFVDLGNLVSYENWRKN